MSIDIANESGIDVDEVGLAAPRLSDRRLIGALERAAARGAHLRLLLDPGETPNRAVAAASPAASARRTATSRWQASRSSSACSTRTSAAVHGISAPATRSRA